MPQLCALSLRVFFCLGLFAFARPALGDVLTLEAARKSARAGRADPKIHAARLERATALIKKAGSLQRPRFVATLNTEAAPGNELVTIEGRVEDGPLEDFLVSASRPIDQGIDAFAPQFRYGAMVGLQWNLYDFGRTSALIAAARAEAEAQAADQELAKRLLEAQVDATYLAWLGATERVAIERRALDAAQKRLRDTETRIDEGSVAPSLLLSAQADVTVAELAFAEMETGRKEAQFLLEDALGQRLSDDTRPDVRLLDRAPVSTSTSEDPAVAALAARVRAARASAERHDAARRPQLGASALAGVRGQLDTVFPAYRAQVTVQIPLWDGGASAADAAAARAEARELAERHAEAKRAAADKHRRAEHAVRASTHRVKLATSLRGLVEARLRDARERFEDGAATPQEIRALEAELRTAERTLLGTKIARTRAVLERQAL